MRERGWECCGLSTALRPREGKLKGAPGEIMHGFGTGGDRGTASKQLFGKEEYRGPNSTGLWHKSELCRGFMGH